MNRVHRCLETEPNGRAAIYSCPTRPCNGAGITFRGNGQVKRLQLRDMPSIPSENAPSMHASTRPPRPHQAASLLNDRPLGSTPNMSVPSSPFASEGEEGMAITEKRSGAPSVAKPAATDMTRAIQQPLQIKHLTRPRHGR